MKSNDSPEIPDEVGRGGGEETMNIPGLSSRILKDVDRPAEH